MPYVPVKLAGILIEPPPSDPVAMVHIPEIRAAAAPPLDPPDVFEISQGFLQ